MSMGCRRCIGLAYRRVCSWLRERGDVAALGRSHVEWRREDMRLDCEQEILERTYPWDIPAMRRVLWARLVNDLRWRGKVTSHVAGGVLVVDDERAW